MGDFILFSAEYFTSHSQNCRSVGGEGQSVENGDRFLFFSDPNLLNYCGVTFIQVDEEQ